MTVMVVGKFNVDPDRMSTVFHDRKEDVLAVSNDARAQGALHHHFAVTKGQVMVIDEWMSAEAFQQFFRSQPKIGDMMQEAGMKGEPEFSFYEVGDMPGQF